MNDDLYKPFLMRIEAARDLHSALHRIREVLDTLSAAESH